MPLVEDSDQLYLLQKQQGKTPVSAAAVSTFAERNKAFMAQENPLMSLIVKERNLPGFFKETDYRAWDDLTEEERLDKNFIDDVLYVDSAEELQAVRNQRHAEARRRATVAEGGVLESLLLSAADPFNYLAPGGAAAASYKAGGSILKGAAVTALASTADASLIEIANHSNQLTRTYGESAANITGAALLGGVLGLGVGAVQKQFTKAQLKAIDRSMNPEGAEGNSVMAHNSRGIGADEVMNDAKVRGRFVRKFARLIAHDPLLRTMTSHKRETRHAVNELAENPLAMDKDTGTAVESLVKSKVDGRSIEYLTLENEHYKRYLADGGKLSHVEFVEEVGKAVRNPQKNIHIQAAAEDNIKIVIEPTTKEAIEAGLLPDTMEVKTAQRYLHRMWDKDKLTANYKEALDTFTRWLDEQQVERFSAWKEQLDELKLDADADPKAISKLQDKLDIEPHTADELKRIAGQIIDRIRGTPDGRLPYDYQIDSGGGGGTSRSGLSGPFKERAFLIPDELVEDYLINNIHQVTQRYLSQVVPDIELKRRFDDPAMTDQIDAIRSAYGVQMEKAKTPREAKRIEKAMKADIRDIAAMRDRIRGIYNIPDPDNIFVRMARTARDLNYMRLLGGVMASSWSDAGRVIGAEGIARVFGDGLKPLISNFKAFRMSATEAKSYGIGAEALKGRSNAEILADVADYTAGGSLFERAARKGAQKFSAINLIDRWTSAMKQLHIVTMQTRVINELNRGVYDERLGQLGITEGDAIAIAKELNTHGVNIDGVQLAKAKDWGNRKLAEKWGAALRKESDRVILVPGQERPLFMSTEVGKTMLQFKTFMFSATQRIALSTLQRRDKFYIQGLLAQITLGMMTYAFKQWDADRALSDDPRVWIVEGVDRSGITGIFAEVNNTLEKITGNRVGLRPAVGIDTPSSRYASRSVVDSMVGPTFGLAGDMVSIAAAATGERDWTPADTRTLRRLAPGQNLSLFRQIIDKLEGR